MPDHETSEQQPAPPAPGQPDDGQAIPEIDGYYDDQTTDRLMIRAIGQMLVNLANVEEFSDPEVKKHVNDMVIAAAGRARWIFESHLREDY